MKNDPNIDYFEGSVDEYKQVKEDLFPYWIDISNVPTILGETMVERLTKFTEFRNKGIFLYDSKQK